MIKHLALIMDGNRRWAKKQGLLPLYGHNEGVETVKRVVEFCLKREISYLSLYTFSIENFRRSPEEVKHLFEILATELENGLDQFLEQGIRIRFIGDRTLFPRSVMPTIEHVEHTTMQQSINLTLIFLFCYGGRQEIIQGIKQVVHRAKAGELTEDAVTEQSFKEFLWMGDLPEPDLIVRTGGYQRLSNFLLYYAAYSELYFLDCLWPELQTHHLEQAVAQYDQWKRNFGR